MSKRRPKVIAFDFDQTIAMYSTSEWKKGYVTKIPIKAKCNETVRRLMKDLVNEGHKVIVYTSRWWGDYNTIQKWLVDEEVYYHDLICGRFLADCYICDKSINPHYPDVRDRCYDMLEGGK